MQITVRTLVNARLAQVWQCYTQAQDIREWNAASDDWHTTHARLELREGGRFCYRMEAKDGGHGFDFEGVFTSIIAQRLIEYDIDGRAVQVLFAEKPASVEVTVTFDAENSFPAEQQRAGWQAILERFKTYTQSLI